MDKDSIRKKIIALTNARYPKTICPSEVLPSEDKKNKVKMELVREVARELADKNLIEIMQKEKVIDYTNIKGPIRLKKKEST
ncbi:hypothetical protein DOM21_15035 [Bacteriovorax stolpii]|uniref:DUF3253 domain-containing protein n=1 Tax=Bacteriovorax stolpii TaxID=960 RepID=UPI0011574B15|nr:DUF3253 domain-containing protein [Bacteriovorax stolpii]QDK42740.1 hypothetical protein DOM21_15035 [Bacteriovorax stolpii]